MFIWLRKARPILISVTGYLLFTLSVFFLFLYINFPFKQIEKRAIRLLEEKGVIRLDIRETLFKPPASYIWRGVRFNAQNIPYLDGMELDLLSARLNILPLFKRRIVTDFKAEGIGGSLNGRLVARRDAGGFLYYINGNGANIDLGRMIQIKDNAGTDIAGRLRLNLDYSWPENNLVRGDGIFDLEVAGLKIKNIEANGFPVKELIFSSLLGRISLKGGVVNIEKLTARTIDMDIAGSGNIIPRNGFMESMLNLTFNINVKGEGPIATLLSPFASPNIGRPIVLAVKGSMNHPLYYLNDVQLNR